MFVWTPSHVTINGERFSTELFGEMEPDFRVPEGCTRIVYVPGKPGHWTTKSHQYVLGGWFTPIGDRCIAKLKDLKFLQKEETRNRERIDALP